MENAKIRHAVNAGYLCADEDGISRKRSIFSGQAQAAGFVSEETSVICLILYGLEQGASVMELNETLYTMQFELLE